jgi:hypothetical protein
LPVNHELRLAALATGVRRPVGWVNQRQQQMIAFQNSQIEFLFQKLAQKRLRLTDDQQCLLAVKSSSSRNAYGTRVAHIYLYPCNIARFGCQKQGSVQYALPGSQALLPWLPKDRVSDAD